MLSFLYKLFHFEASFEEASVNSQGEKNKKLQSKNIRMVAKRCAEEKSPLPPFVSCVISFWRKVYPSSISHCSSAVFPFCSRVLSIITPMRDRRLMLLMRRRLRNIPEDFFRKLRNLLSQRSRMRERLELSCTKDGRVRFARTTSSSLVGFCLVIETRELVEGSSSPAELPSLWH